MCAPGFATASSSPPPIPRSPRCALYTTTRVQSTLVTHAARVRASPATHVLSHCNMQGWESTCKDGCSCHWPLAGCRPALRWHRQHAHKHCNRSATSTARESRSSCANAVHPATRNIATVHRHDDDERDYLERDEEDDCGDEGRCERVRAARACDSHAPKRTRKHAAKGVAGT